MNISFNILSFSFLLTYFPFSTSFLLFISIVPSSTFKRPTKHLSNVVLPFPEGPTIALIFPFFA